MGGIEWLVEAFGCEADVLRSQKDLTALFRTIVSDMKLRPIGQPVWHQFPETGGITGFWLLQESHLAIHTFPEFQSACLNVFCCRKHRAIDWKGKLAPLLGAKEVQYREYERVYRK